MANDVFLLECLLTDNVGIRRWVFQQSVPSLNKGLSVASHMCSTYEYRLRLPNGEGFLYLDWKDEDNSDYCTPVWVTERPV